MYSANYGFNPNAPGFPSASPNPQNPQMQPGPGQQAPQPGQPMMYNPQQFAGMGPQGYVQNPNPAMMASAGPGATGMMPNAGMQHMATNGLQMTYQQPFTNSPYGAAVPSPTGPQQFHPNYMVGGGMAGFPMSAAGMPQQHPMMQRMGHQQPNPMAGTPQRPTSASQGAPPGNMGQPQQFATPQQTPQVQTPTQQPNMTVTTPQTPTFPSGGQAAAGNGSVGTPLSPGTESKEKELFSLLLQINNELLMELIQLQHTQEEQKKDPSSTPADLDVIVKDYTTCLRRLNANLSYLAPLADRKSKPPPCPAYLMPPSLNMALKVRSAPPVADSSGVTDPISDREERVRSLSELYSKLQGYFPGIDPRKEPAYPVAPRPPGAGQQHPGQGQRNPSQSHPSPGLGSMQRPPQMGPGMTAAVPPVGQAAHTS